MTLDRFKVAQDSSTDGIETALAELRAGQKSSHWIWYVFPQLAGLGRSSTAQAYALLNLDEAIEYLRDPVLGSRLARATQAVAEQLALGVRLTELMGGTTDALKLVSSLTLFELAVRRMNPAGQLPENSDFAHFALPCEMALAVAEQQGFPRCRHTLAHAGRTP